ncbi:MAG: PA2778 family cysteine peptidase [Pseudomonadota bacterium]
MRQLDAGDARTELADTPFFPQERYQCGPAALTTALTMSGADVKLEEIVDKVYLPGKSGSLQAEMLAATRTSGRLPYVIDGTLSAIQAELLAGRPVIVLQNLGVAAIPRWHFAVVVGVDAANDRIILRSGTDRRRVTATDVFLRTWQRGDYWALVVLRPEELPAAVDKARYFKAVSALEQAGRLDAAAIAWETALATWPGNPIALFGLGNVRLASGRPAEAEKIYRALLEQDAQQTGARNNLALALAGQQRFHEALAEIELALEQNTVAALEGELRDTQATIRNKAQESK